MWNDIPKLLKICGTLNIKLLDICLWNANPKLPYMWNDIPKMLDKC